LIAARTVARRVVERGEEAVVVTMLCDNADKYLSEPFWND
jgi:cysteine synthase